MAFRLVLLSGAVSSGKTSLARALETRYGARVFRTADLLAERAKPRDRTRSYLQRLGQRLDRETDGLWVAEALVQQMPDLVDKDELVVVDAVRFEGQIQALRDAYGTGHVAHVHLTAGLETLAQRYGKRTPRRGITELASYAEVRRNATEQRVDRLAAEADVVIDTERNTPDDVVARVASRLRLYGERGSALVDVLVGGQYGSEGKGHIASYLAPEYDLLVRGGGPNAGHTVMLETGERRVQHHLPSGTGVSNARLLLVAGSVIDVPVLLDEINRSKVGTDRLSIDPHAIVITDEDREAEKRLTATIGSTGRGVGAATARRIMGRSEAIRLAADDPDLKAYTSRTAAEVLDESFAADRRVLLEGTQGSALGIFHGPYPHVTSRDTTVAGVLAESGIPPARVRKVAMVCRTYPIRVQSPVGGTSGDLPLELSWDEVARRAGLDVDELRTAERTSTTGRERRVSEFDWSLLHRSAALNGPTDIALTFVDYLSASNQRARRLEQLELRTLEFISEVEQVASAPVSLISTRFHRRAIIDRRNW
jgi:adenylosuccinate synthase